MRFTYALTNESYVICGSNRISYGIDVYAGAEPDRSAAVIASVKDITSDRQKLAGLVGKCNDLQLSPTHLYDVIEDLIIS